MYSAPRQKNKDQKTGETMMKQPSYQNQNCDITLNSEAASPVDDKENQNGHELDLHRRGSNFQSSNAFDESIQESPIRVKDETNKTLVDENR